MINIIMPSINRKGIREKKVKYKSDKKAKSASFYDSAAWARLRKTFMSLHPLCSECLKRNIVTPGAEVHHARKFLSGKTEEEQWQLFLDENNLRTVCRKCHNGYHRKMDKYGLNTCDDLTDIEYKEAHDNE